MKTFIFTLLIFALLLATITFNFHYINSVCDTLEAKIGALTTHSTKDELNALWELWCREKSYISLSVCAGATEEFEDRLLELIAMHRIGDEKAFYRARALTVGAISSIRRLERFDLDNLL